jgi:hypothetical protein
MKQTTLKQAALSLMAVATLMMVAGSLTPSFAQWPWDRGRNNDRYDDRNHRHDQQDHDAYGNPRNRNNRGRNDGYYGNNRNGNYGYGRNGGFRNSEQEKGYRDGLRRGQEDRNTNRIPDPNNSSHYRKGNADYRYGFEIGYQDSYPSRYGNNNNRRRW